MIRLRMRSVAPGLMALLAACSSADQGPSGNPGTSPTLAGVAIFPPDNAWNTPVISTRSSTMWLRIARRCRTVNQSVELGTNPFGY